MPFAPLAFLLFSIAATEKGSRAHPEANRGVAAYSLPYCAINGKVNKLLAAGMMGLQGL